MFSEFECFESKKTGRPWIVCFVSSLVFFNEFLQMNFFSMLGTVYSQHHSLNSVEFSKLSSFFFFGMATFLVPSGILIDNLSIRKVLISVLIFYGMYPIFLIFNDDLYLLYLSRFISGVLSSFCLISCVSLMKRWYPERTIGRPLGIIISIGLFGGFLSQHIQAFFLERNQWKLSLTVFSVIAFFSLALVYAFLFDYPGKINKKQKNNFSLEYFKSILPIIKNKNMWILGVCCGVLNLPVTLLASTWGNAYLLQKGTLSLKEVASIISMMFLAMIVASPWVGYVFDKSKNILFLGLTPNM